MIPDPPMDPSDNESGTVVQEGVSATNPVKTQHSIPLIGLFTLACLYTLHLASGLLIPMFIAGFLSLLLAPIVRRLARVGIPRIASSAVLVTAVFAMLVVAVSTLAEPTEEWLAEAPRELKKLQRHASPAKGRLENIKAIAEEVDELSSVETPEQTTEVVVQESGALQRFLVNLPSRIAALVLVIFLTFFLLVSGDNFLRKLTRCGRNWGERKKIVVIARHIQSELSTYLGGITIINVLLGIATTIAMYLMEVPNPYLWGVMVAIFNFAPYVGALVSLFVLGIVGFSTHDSLPQAIMVPTVFLVLTTLEGQLITPLFLGKKMSISPTIIFLSVVFWGWLWGVAGALMAVPIVTSINVLLSYFPPFQPLRIILNSSKAD